MSTPDPPAVPKLSEVLTLLDERYDPAWAEPWDAVGLVCGDPDAPVRRVALAVDPVQPVVDEALAGGADLLITHHPLYLKGTTGVPATTFKGRVVHTLIRGGCALYTAHTNADTADPGVSDALAAALGLTVLRPLVPDPGDPDGRRGIGRVCALPEPLTLAEFAERAARSLPATRAGLRVAGDGGQVLRTVAVSGGAGDSFFAEVRAAGVDAYLTADLRHHPAAEAREAAPVALIDAAHWATEHPWLDQAAELLREDAARRGWEIEVTVSRLVTDPWTSAWPASTD
ncbi:Nif3-like dinuclear metal center hexameric protein [Allostreptomyces psammosilenae]|uniref:GTP cyclohydrolase 1 type 2 homolog n=1 Tax=Allostreptomyces psammosilenae TaxID=1892865 RepID=A0A852ZWR1_9ACTN|nr:Nif3-like dinuclear metal center hexameric protein [Allostreptomyces psammosilenae]NYI06806.1 dinuclear metal center YbgI/SA1388 family protein [Allostreptomyces psammosilenae]